MPTPFVRVALIVCLLSALVGPATEAQAQSAAFRGKALIDPTEKPLANAEILIKDLKRSVRTDSAGNFLFTGLPAGRTNVTVRLVGYETIEAIVILSLAQVVEAKFLITESSTKLDAVNVVATANNPYAGKLVEFEQRRALGAGRFLTGDVFTKEAGQPPSAFLAAKVPGLRIISSSGQNWVASARMGLLGTGNPGKTTMERIPVACYVQVIVNGATRYSGQKAEPMFDIDELDSKEIIGFEFHSVATTPSQYNRRVGPYMNACGTAIIWTK